jgi:Fe-S-cluster containining protein
LTPEEARPVARIEPDDTIPLVTREEFNRIECNRCGVCCERIHMPGPLVLAQEIGRYAIDRAAWSPEALEALGLEDAMLDRERLIDWWSQFTPVARVEEEGKPLQYQYRCARFYRDLEGAGCCTAYDDRPSTCRAFPNGRPMNAIPECSWNVRIID